MFRYWNLAWVAAWIAAAAAAVTANGSAATAPSPAPSVPPPPAASPASSSREVSPRFLELPEWLRARESMLSGLAWYGDDLILLPQQRRIRGQRSLHRGKVYSIPRAALEREIDAPTGSPLPVDTWSLEAPTIDELEGYEGLEAIAFAGDAVFMTVECDAPPKPVAWLLRGRVDRAARRIRMELPEVRIESRSGIVNLTEEALLVHGNEVVSLHEANGAKVNPQAVAHAFPLNRAAERPWAPRRLRMPPIEFRVTDASEVDADGCFWVSNFRFPGDTLLAATDGFIAPPPPGTRAAAVPWLERFVELRITPDAIVPTGRPPIYLEPGGEPRNWEGLARLGSRGLLACIDKYPVTRLAWVPFP